jgi:hypothetical protein
MYSFKLFKQNVCTVNVHEMYYKFNPGPSPGVIFDWAVGRMTSLVGHLNDDVSPLTNNVGRHPELTTVS